MLSNFCKLTFPFESFQARTFPYSKEKLDDLRSKHNTTHSSFKVGDKIYSIWAEGNDLDEGDVCQVQDNEITVIERAAKHLFYRTILRNLEDRVPENFYPLQLISPRSEHDIAAKFLPSELKGIIQFQRLTEFEFRKYYEDSKPRIGITANLRRTWNCSKTLRDLIQDGFDPINLPVKNKSEIRDLDGVIPNKHFAIGRVTSVIDETKCIVKTNEGEKEYFTDLLEVRKSRNEVFKILAYYKDAQTAQRLFDRIYEAGGLTADAKKYYLEIHRAIGYLRKWTYNTKCGFSFELNQNLSFDLPSISLNPTTFIFDATPGAASPMIPGGLYEYGPYDKARFTPKSPKFLVVCSSYNRGGYSEMMGALKKGLPSTRYYKNGLVHTYQLSDLQIEVQDLEHYNAKSVRQAILERLEENNDIDLVIIEGSDEPEDTPAKNNPYWSGRALCLGRGIPVQAIQPKHTREAPEYMQWKLAPLALQIYAKLGGTPWAVQATQNVDHEILIGIGNYIQRSSEFKGGTQKRYVGVTTFFSKEGSFILSSKCKAVPYDEYLGALLQNLKTAIEQIENDFSWSESQTVRLVFHVFKPLRYDEVNVIDELTRQFPKYKIKYAFVTISNRQPIALFDNNDRSPESDKGHWVPERGTNYILSPLQSLIQLKGKKQIKAKTHGFTKPCVIRIHEKSTFRDIHYITQQVYDFSHLSWRGFQPMATPVTILYSELIAEKLQVLSEFNDWNPSVIGIELKRKKWFL